MDLFTADTQRMSRKYGACQNLNFHQVDADPTPGIGRTLGTAQTMMMGKTGLIPRIIRATSAPSSSGME
jgi:hypothetical protein